MECQWVYGLPTREMGTCGWEVILAVFSVCKGGSKGTQLGRLAYGWVGAKPQVKGGPEVS